MGVTRRWPGVVAGGAVLLLGALCRADGGVDPALRPYGPPVAGVFGTLRSVGSDTMNDLMAAWAASFRDLYPGVRVEVDGKGSGTAPRALALGQSTVGAMSRAMKDAEVDAFERTYGYPPTALRTGIDLLALYVHKDNPLPALTLEQVDAIFSKNRRGGYPRDIVTWGDLGLGGEWASKPISLYGRNSVSGTYGFFKQHALFGGDMKDRVKEEPGSASVVASVAADRYGIGYSGIGFATADVRVLPLSSGAGAPPVPADPAHAYSGAYPLTRFLYLYVRHEPGSRPGPLLREFLRFALSRDGQAIVLRSGYFPITEALAERDLEGVGIQP